MSDIINLSCPSCGGKLQFTNDIERFACGYCGNELIVRRSGGIVSLSPVVNAIKDVQLGVDKTASELAITRLTNEKNRISAQIKALENQKSSKKSLSIIFPIFGFIMLSLGILLMTSSSDNSCGIMLILISITLFFASYIYFEEYKKNNQMINGLLEMIDELNVELDKHKKIVSMG